MINRYKAHAMAGAFPILFITATRIGDAVLSTGLLRRLHDEIPNARFTIACGPAAAPLFADMPRLDEVHVMRKAPWAGHWLRLWSRVRARRWGLVVDLRGSALARFVSAKRRAVWTPLPPEAPVMHKVLEAARLLKLEEDPPAPHLFISDARQAQADALVGEGGPILAIGPGAKWIGKAWPAERFSELSARLLGAHGALEGGRLMILGAEEDRPAAATIRPSAPSGQAVDLTGRIDLLTAAACLRRARLFVGNDSGLMHVAAAAGAPTLGLFGPSDEGRYGPWGPLARSVRGARGFEDFKARDPGLNQAINHMFDLPTETALRAASDLVAATTTAAASAPDPLRTLPETRHG